jgi:hypothetical protein
MVAFKLLPVHHFYMPSAERVEVEGQIKGSPDLLSPELFLLKNTIVRRYLKHLYPLQHVSQAMIFRRILSKISFSPPTVVNMLNTKHSPTIYGGC